MAIVVKIGKDCKTEMISRTLPDGREVSAKVIIDPNTVQPDGTHDYNQISVLTYIVDCCANKVLELGDEEYNPFAYIVNRLEYVYTYYQNETCATDDQYMFINPTFWAELFSKGTKWCEMKGLDPKNKNNAILCNLYIFLHEIMHDALDHIEEWNTMHNSYPNHLLANVSMDYVCNKTIEKLFPNMKGMGTYLEACFDEKRGDKHWVDEYEDISSQQQQQQQQQDDQDEQGGGNQPVSEDRKRGYKEMFDEIRELLGGNIDDKDVYSKRAAINKIISVYGPIIKQAKGIDISMLKESVEDNLNNISNDYDAGVIDAIKDIINDLKQDGDLVQTGGSSGQGGLGDRIVDRRILTPEQSGGEGDSSDQQNNDGQQGQGNGQGQNGQQSQDQNGQGQGQGQGNQQGQQQGQGQGQNGQGNGQQGNQNGQNGNQQGQNGQQQGQGGSKGNQQGQAGNQGGNPENGHTSTEQPEAGSHMGWDMAKRIKDYLGLPDRNVDRVNGIKGSDRQKTRSNIKRLEDEQNYKWSMSNRDSDDSSDIEVENTIKKLGVLDWKPILKDFLNKKKTVRNKGKWKDEYRKFDPEVSIRRINRHKVYTTDHITIILDTSGSVLGTKGTYEFLVSEIGQVLDSVGNSSKLLIDFINFGSATNIYRFVHERGHFFDKTIHKFPQYVETGSTIYTTSLGMSHIVMNDKRIWDRFYDQSLVEDMEKKLAKNTEAGVNPDDFGPSACTVLFTDTDFAYGSKYRGNGFGDSKIDQFHNNTMVFLILDGTTSSSRDDKQAIDPFAKNSKYLKFSDKKDEDFDWNIIFVNRDCLRGRMNEGLTSFDDDTFADQQDELNQIEDTYDEEEKDIDYYGNNMIITHSSDESKYDNCEVIDNKNKTVTIKSTTTDRVIPVTVYDDIRRITEPLNYLVDGHMVITGIVRAEKLPSGVVGNSSIILDKCDQITVDEYAELQKKYGRDHIAYRNCALLCEETQNFSDHPITTLGYILSYWSDTMKKLLEDEFAIKLYARDASGKTVPIEGIGTSDVLPEYWNCSVGVYLERKSRSAYIDEVEVEWEDVMETNNSKYHFEYDGFPPFIKFIGTNGRIVVTYKQESIGILSLKGSMCRYNLLDPVPSKSLPREVIQTKYNNRGIYLMADDAMEETYVLIDSKQEAKQ